MGFRLSVVAAAAICLAFAALATPEEDAAYIVEQTVTEELFQAAINAQKPLITGAILNDLTNGGIEISDVDRFIDIFVEEFLDEFTDTMRSETLQVYLDSFSAEELESIAAFYATDAGQALIAQTPMLMQEGARMGQVAGSQAGLNAADRVATRLEAEGVTLTTDPSMMDGLLDALRGR